MTFTYSINFTPALHFLYSIPVIDSIFFHLGFDGTFVQIGMSFLTKPKQNK